MYKRQVLDHAVGGLLQPAFAMELGASWGADGAGHNELGIGNWELGTEVKEMIAILLRCVHGKGAIERSLDLGHDWG